MILPENYSLEHIDGLAKRYGSDRFIAERAMYAFGLLEAISRTGLKFTFKGGSCLMLLLDNPKRLSTDIDIMVDPGTDVEHYIEEAGKIFPFVDYQESIRPGHGNIEKRHFRFFYNSPIMDDTITILLDVLYEKEHYASVIERPIESSLILTANEPLYVKMPNVNCILGDKLTTFAPHTTGIPFMIDKDMEIIKQFHDCTTLFHAMDDFSEVKETFRAVANTEMTYRNLKIKPEDILEDAIESCMCIIGNGRINAPEYDIYNSGIDRIQGHLFDVDLNRNTIAYSACELMYLCSCIYRDTDTCDNSMKADTKDKIDIGNNKVSRAIGYIRKANKTAGLYLKEAVALLGDDYERLQEHVQNRSLERVAGEEK